MKKLVDGTWVTSRSFYFLLDYNDREDKRTMLGLWNIWRLQDLNQQQYLYLFNQAVEKEKELIQNAEHGQPK